MGSASAQSQIAPPVWAAGNPLALNAVNNKGQSLDVASLRKQVVVVFVGSTSCAVCLDSLPELRINAAGWQAKPFTLVALNADTEGKIIQRIEGRQAPEVWDGVAEPLP